MGPKSTPAKQKNTLFSYFSPGAKSPAVSKEGQGQNEVLSTKRSPNTSPKSKSKSPKKSEPAIEYEPGDLLWCKLVGYSWWPSLVCNHPTQNTHYKGGKNPQVHVQFFDTPVSRAWVLKKNCHWYKGSDDERYQLGGMFHTTSAPVIKGVADADKAMKMDKAARLDLVVELQPSEDEEEEDEEEMDIDDAESDADQNDSKENMDDSGTKHKKSPRKNSRSTRRSVKRRRIIIEADSDENHESEDEFKPDEDDDGSDDDVSSGVDEDDITSASGSEPNSPIKLPQKRKRKEKEESKPAWGPKSARSTKPSTSASKKNSLAAFAKDNDSEPTASNDIADDVKTDTVKSNDIASPKLNETKVSEATKSKLAAFTAADSVGQSGESSGEKVVYLHNKYEWLQPDKICDSKKRLKSDPEYDARTLYIPDSEKGKFTPAMRQWWNIKCEHFDTVLFFKMGKFYELFHMDATIAVNELGLIYMKGDYAHSGFPEIAYTRYADTLVNRGYKVARIEQTETPDMMTQRCKTMGKAASKFDKVVKREVCRITTKGTQSSSFLSGECSDSKSSYLLALSEKESDTAGCSVYGICFVDTSIGKFHIGQFTDDRHTSRLCTLLAHYPPVQILYEKGRLSPRTQSVISNTLTSVIKEALVPKTEFWESSKTLKVLSEESYFKSEKSEEVVWPETIKSMMSDSDALGQTAADQYNLAVSSLGALTWYLQYCLMDDELLSMKNFEKYEPLDNLNGERKSEVKSTFNSSTQYMVLDGVTLTNLDVIGSSSTDTLQGTLIHRLDQCCTPFGKRLFRQWLCAPLCNPVSINDRLNAVEDLIGCQDVVAEVTEIMKKLPDLERLLSRIHSLGTNKSKKHPDSRAILYEEVTYSKRKIEDFLATLDGFKAVSSIAMKFKPSVADFKSKLLQKTLGIEDIQDNGAFPNLREDLQFFDNAFDHKKAKKDGVIVPSSGVDEDFDKAVDDINSTQDELQQYLDKQKKRLNCRSIVYWGTAKNRYQMEIPESALRNVPDEYTLMSSKKGAKRFRTSEIEEMLAQLTDAEDRKDAALKDVMRRIFNNFDKRYKKWDTAVQCISVLDVLLSMAQYSRCADGNLCRPEIVLPNENQQPFIEIREAQHPCVCSIFSGGDFIPNDTVIGIKDEQDEDDGNHGNSQVVLVTGPNMGGKSTLMRQVGLVVIMAQMGCYVPATKCRLTPVDRVFTRLGASDRIMAGESTFFVELSETSSILQHATQHSLVLVDELGRGTATYDGTAIACSVVQELSRNIKCRTLFSTHYHSLVEEFSHDPNIRLGHMSCMVENEDEEDPTQETITFLYKFTTGACPKSYGFNAARLANLPEEVIKVAVHKAKEFESSLERVKQFRNIWKNPNKQCIEAAV